MFSVPKNKASDTNKIHVICRFLYPIFTMTQKVPEELNPDNKREL